MPTGDEDPKGQQLQGIGLDLQGQHHRGAGQVHGDLVLSGDKLPLTGRLFSVLKKAALLCLTQNQIGCSSETPSKGWLSGAAARMPR